MFVAMRKISDKVKKSKSEADEIYNKHLPKGNFGNPDNEIPRKFKDFLDDLTRGSDTYNKPYTGEISFSHPGKYRYIVGIAPPDKRFKSKIYTWRTYAPATIIGPYEKLQRHEDKRSRLELICTCDGIFDHETVRLRPGTSLLDLWKEAKDPIYPRSAWPLKDFYKHHGRDHPRKITGPYHPPDMEPRGRKVEYPNDDDRDIDEVEHVPVYSDHHEPPVDKGSGEFYYFTHGDFIKTSFKRCLIEAQRPYRQQLREKDRLPEECPYPDKKSCVSCEYAIRTSLTARERGADYLPEVLQYPSIFFDTLKDCPFISEHEAMTDEDLKRVFKEINEKFPERGYTYPESAATIRKMRQKDIRPIWIPPYLHDTYNGTAIATLAKSSKVAGVKAIQYLFMYFTSCVLNESLVTLTRDNFIDTISGPNATPQNKNLARKYYDLLVESKVLFGYEQFHTREHLLYASGKPWQNYAPKLQRLGSFELYRLWRCKRDFYRRIGFCYEK